MSDYENKQADKKAYYAEKAKKLRQEAEELYQESCQMADVIFCKKRDRNFRNKICRLFDSAYTLSELAFSYFIPNKLITYKGFPPTLIDWVVDNLSDDTLANICRNGKVNGFDNFGYFANAAELYGMYHGDIWEILEEESKMFNQSSCLDYIASFQQAANVKSDKNWKKFLVSFAVSNLACRLMQERDKR